MAKGPNQSITAAQKRNLEQILTKLVPTYESFLDDPSQSENDYRQRYDKAASLEDKGRVLLGYLRAHPQEAARSSHFTAIVSLLPYIQGDRQSHSIPGRKARIKISRSQRQIIERADLTDRQKEVSYLRLQGIGFTEIARRLGCHHSTVQERWKAAAKKIARVRSGKNLFSW